MNEHDQEILTLLTRLKLYGLAANYENYRNEPWLQNLLQLEQDERKRRSLENRLRLANLGSYKPMVEYDWSWPTAVERYQCEEILNVGFVSQGSNVVIMGSNGLGKTMLLKNIGYQAVLAGYQVLFRTASDLLRDLGAQESMQGRARRLKYYCQPALLCIDEVGYLSYDNTHADLLFEVVSRRYNANKSIALTTNRVFSEWSEVFPNSACVVTLVDRLVHRAELVKLEGDSYRKKEAIEAQERRSKERLGKAKSKPKPRDD